MKKEKIKIVDLSTLIPGPFASYLLQKYLTADIIKFEDITRGDHLKLLRPTKNGKSLAYMAINNKKNIIPVDLRSNGLAKIQQEIKRADIFVQNYKAGKAQRYGLGFEDVLAVNPDILYCTIRGFGEKHPLAQKGAHDLNILALSGYLDQQIQLTHSYSLPPIQIADILTSYHVCLRIITSLYNDEKGKHLNISMYDAALEALTLYNIPQLMNNSSVTEEENVMSGIYPCYRLYKSSDDKWVTVAALESSLWVDFCHVIKRADLISKQFSSEAAKEVEREMGKYKSSYWLKDEFDFCVTPVLSIRDARKLGYVN